MGRLRVVLKRVRQAEGDHVHAGEQAAGAWQHPEQAGINVGTGVCCRLTSHKLTNHMFCLTSLLCQTRNTRWSLLQN